MESQTVAKREMWTICHIARRRCMPGVLKLVYRSTGIFVYMGWDSITLIVMYATMQVYKIHS